MVGDFQATNSGSSSNTSKPAPQSISISCTKLKQLLTVSKLIPTKLQQN